VIFRYVLPAVIGVSLFTALLCRRTLAGRPGIVLLLAGWTVLMAGLNVIEQKRRLFELSDLRRGVGPFHLLALQPQLPPDDLPIVVDEYHTFMQLFHYSNESTKRRLVHLPDYNAWISQQIESHRIYGQWMEPYETFVKRHRSFYLYDTGSDPLVARLIASGARLRDSGLNDVRNIHPRPGHLYHVSFDDDHRTDDDRLTPELARTEDATAPQP
jgi:hypothetical protein